MASAVEVKEALDQLKEVFEQKGVWELLPLDLLEVGAIFGLAPMGGMMLRKIRADHVDDPRLTPNEKAVLEMALSTASELTWADLWLTVIGKENELRTSNRSNYQVRGEVAEVLKRISNIFCYLWEYPKFFERDHPQESEWWSAFIGEWGIASKPLAYARRLAPEPPPPPLEETINAEVAKDFRNLC